MWKPIFWCSGLMSRFSSLTQKVYSSRIHWDLRLDLVRVPILRLNSIRLFSSDLKPLVLSIGIFLYFEVLFGTLLRRSLIEAVVFSSCQDHQKKIKSEFIPIRKHNFEIWTHTHQEKKKNTFKHDTPPRSSEIGMKNGRQRWSLVVLTFQSHLRYKPMLKVWKNTAPTIFNRQYVWKLSKK